MNAAVNLQPVLVGAGVATQHEQNWSQALEAIDLMLKAVAAAGDDCGAPAALQGVELICVPRGRWKYVNPAGEIARHIGVGGARTLLASVGVLQQTLIGLACERIARGEIRTVLVVGGDTGHRILRARLAGARAGEPWQDDLPDEVLEPQDDLRHPVEVRAGMNMPVGLYAIMESAHRAQQGWGVHEHRDLLAQLWTHFSSIAAENPHAWLRNAVAADTIREESARNPMQAFPYTKLLCSSWNIDQAGSLLLCSAERARELGIRARAGSTPWRAPSRTT